MGSQMAAQLIETDQTLLIIAFGVLIGFATTMAEPALMATLRVLVACGLIAFASVGPVIAVLAYACVVRFAAMARTPDSSSTSLKET